MYLYVYTYIKARLLQHTFYDRYEYFRSTDRLCFNSNNAVVHVFLIIILENIFTTLPIILLLTERNFGAVLKFLSYYQPFSPLLDIRVDFSYCTPFWSTLGYLHFKKEFLIIIISFPILSPLRNHGYSIPYWVQFNSSNDI